MICIAAFIVLCLLSVVVAFLSIFKHDLWKKYTKVFKKSWSCFGKRVTLQKCETGFGDDVKNSLLSRLALKNPKLLKPASVGIEVVSILIVFVAAWSVIEASKAGLALWTLGTCNVTHPSACSLGAEACSIDDVSGETGFFGGIKTWLSDWGEIFGAIPDKFRSWDVEQFDFAYIELGTGEELAVDIMDPQCIVCSNSFKAQYEGDFFKSHKVRLVVFPIRDSEGAYKFEHSKMLTSYIYSVDKMETPEKYEARDEIINRPSLEMIYRIFAGNRDDEQSYHDFFSYSADAETAKNTVLDWLHEFGYSDEQIDEISKNADSVELNNALDKNNDIVVNNIHAKGIPTMIYDGRKHNGKFEN